MTKDLIKGLKIKIKTNFAQINMELEDFNLPIIKMI